MKIALWRSRPRRAAAIGMAGFLIVCAASGCGRISLAELDGNRSAAKLPGAGQPSGLPLPSQLPLAQFEQKLFDFLNSRRYTQLGWHRDKEVRDTGPFIGGKYYGTHPAVRAYYSPGVVQWLANGRVGKIPDGEIIVKEQY